MNSCVTVKGQVTIPKAVREHLGIKAGQQVKFFPQPGGGVLLLPVIPASRLRGIAHRPGQPTVTLEEMDEAIAEGAIERAGLHEE
jgi:AbrB family looped-hinge helix DNA binding protein